MASSQDIQAAVVLHPGPITVDDINGKFETSQAYSYVIATDKLLFVSEIKVPVAILGAEIDHVSPPEDLKRFGEILSAKLKVRGP